MGHAWQCVESIFCPSSSRTRGWSMPPETLMAPRGQSARAQPADPTTALRKPGRPSQSHTLRMHRTARHVPEAVQSHCRGGHPRVSLLSVYTALPQLPQCLNITNNVRHPLVIDSAPEFFPQLRHKHGRKFTYSKGWTGTTAGRQERGPRIAVVCLIKACEVTEECIGAIGVSEWCLLWCVVV